MKIRIQSSPAVLQEARIKDIKAKYPAWNKLGWIQWGKENLEDALGQKSVSKYLLYLIQGLETNFNVQEEDDEGIDTSNTGEEIREIGDELIDLIKKFEKNQAKLKEKDIYKYTIPQLEKAIGEIGPSSKEQAEKAKEGAEIVYEDDIMFAVRPLTKDASCYYGKNTKWCISATKSQNYFDNYTMRGKAFVMVLMKDLKDDDRDKKIAIVFDDMGGYEETYDAKDDEIGWSGLRNAISKGWSAPTKPRDYEDLEQDEQQSVDELLKDLSRAASENVMDNPPDITEHLEKEVKRIDEAYEPLMESAYANAYVSEGRVSFFGGFTIEVPMGKFIDEIDAISWKTESDWTEEISDELADNLRVFAQDVSVDSTGGDENIHFNIDISSHGFEASTEGYESYLKELLQYDENPKAMRRVIMSVSKKRGFLKNREGIDVLADKIESMSQQLSHFSIKDDTKRIGEEAIIFTSPWAPLRNDIKMSHLTSVPDFKSSKIVPGSYVSQNMNKIVQSNLSALNQKMLSYINKQLPLPGIPQSKLKKVAIPEILEVALHYDGDKMNILTGLSIDDVDVTEEFADSMFEVIQFLDKHFKEIRQIVVATVEDYLIKSKEGLKGPRALPVDGDTEDDIFENVHKKGKIKIKILKG